MRAKVPLVFVTLIVSSLLAPLLVTNVQAAGCSPTCDFEANTNVPSSAGPVRVRLDGAPAPLYTLNYTFSFANDTQHTIEVVDTEIIASGTRYVFKEWRYVFGQWGTAPMLTTPFILDNYTSSSPNGPFVAFFDKQFQASFSFSDPSGQPITPPSNIALQAGPSTVCLGPTCQTPTTYSDQWLSATVWTVMDATWQSMPNTVDGTQTVDVRSGSASYQIRLRAYSATIKVVDRSSNPIPGVSLFVRLSNQTSLELEFTTDGQGQVQLGHIPLGSYNVRVVYQNQEMSRYGDAVLNPVNTIQLDVGGTTSGPIISAVVLLTILGVAMFLLLLAIKVRKPPLPPTI